MENPGGREYKYFTEISQMMFVFGEVQDPLPETVNLVEDIVRSQIIELVCPACFVSSMVWWMCLYQTVIVDYSGADACVATRGTVPLC